MGSKHHLIVDAHGIPLAATLTGAKAHDVTQLLPLVDHIPPVRGQRGHPRRRPERVPGDRAYDSEPHRRELRRRTDRLPRIHQALMSLGCMLICLNFPPQ